MSYPGEIIRDFTGQVRAMPAEWSMVSEGRATKAEWSGHREQINGAYAPENIFYMQIKVISIPVIGGNEANSELNKFLRSVKILEIDQKLVEYGNSLQK